MKILIPNYGCGNLMSVVRMIEHVGGEAEIISEPRRLDSAEKVILAGVGAFDHGIKNLYSEGWVQALQSAKERQIPILGICLGMQLMARSSEEGKLAGLGWFDARVDRFRFEDASLKVPHMGWNSVSVARDHYLVPAGEADRFYFVHSFHLVAENESDVVGRTQYGYSFPSIMSKGSIAGVQFHPEKSHRFGMKLVERFVRHAGKGER